MQLYEGKNNWDNFGNDQVKAAVLKFDGRNELSLTFYSSQNDDRCQVVLDWDEEIKSFRELYEMLYQKKGRQCKLYPDDFRGLMMRGAYSAGGFELTFLKNYQCVQVVMALEKANVFWQGVEQMFAAPGEYRLNLGEETSGEAM